ncbi:MAG: bifunctional 2-polyprenyl-6-hydroxyphenol methylase/3-demethylubiquinol 3-O-methyltransferase UbiG [Pseudomonadota bacterium]
MSAAEKTTIDDAEVERFSKMAAEWWSPTGKFKPLHKFNPVRLKYIRETVVEHFGLEAKADKPFSGLRLLDIGCGGGLLSEPMARLGAEVMGADASETNIEVAKIHMAQSGLDIDYRATTSEALQEAGEQFDVVLNMEVVEHVADVDLFIKSCAAMVKPGGLMFIATINRTPKARFLALFMAETVLRWLPKGTHEYDRLVKPSELDVALKDTGMEVFKRSGVFFNPIADEWRLSKDMDVNYMVVAKRPSTSSG